MARRVRPRLGAIIAMILAQPSPARSEDSPRVDDARVEGQWQTHMLLFRQALSPHPGGALMRTETRAPLVSYLNVRASGLDTALGTDTVDAEVSLWQGAELGPQDVNRNQGDVQTATVRLHTTGDSRRAWITLGRQIEAGGAARFARFDGLSFGVALAPRLTLSAYGGFLVLPRWNRTQYYHLGSVSAARLSEQVALSQPERDDYAVVGGKLSYEAEHLRIVASAYEQRDRSRIGRRNLGLDVALPINERAFLGGSLLLDVDAWQVSTARIFGDVTLGKSWDFSAEYLEAQPALLLSHQSVLSVFGTSGYREVGGTIGARIEDRLRLTGDGYVQFYEQSLPGARVGLGARWDFGRASDPAILSARYQRVDAVELGYHSGHISLRLPLVEKAAATLQGFVYLYDQAILGYKSSLTGSLSVSYPFARTWEILWASVASRSPYAALDASTQLRLTYQFVPRGEGVTW